MSLEHLDFEKPIAELKDKIKELKNVGTDVNFDIDEEIKNLEAKCNNLTKKIFKNLTDWQIIQLARHPLRPYTADYIEHLFTDFQELHGDRNFADDKSIIGGMAKLNDIPVMVIGQQKGRDTKDKLYRNFGMPHPEGYRKAKRLMQLAEKFNLPVITFIDTPGAYPGIDAEARGQSEAIATNLKIMSRLAVPIICAVIGEGCSGGALGIGVGDRTLILQYAYYATISPEGCASILWKDAQKAADAVETMGITANKLKEHNLVDEIVAEPLGGAHSNIALAAANLKSVLTENLTALKKLDLNQLLATRYERITSIGS